VIFTVVREMGCRKMCRNGTILIYFLVTDRTLVSCTTMANVTVSGTRPVVVVGRWTLTYRRGMCSYLYRRACYVNDRNLFSSSAKLMRFGPYDAQNYCLESGTKCLNINALYFENVY